jgi:hypothetical protein
LTTSLKQVYTDIVRLKLLVALLLPCLLLAGGSLRFRDIGVEAILIRVDTLPENRFLVSYRCAVRNHGNTTETFEVRMHGGQSLGRKPVLTLPGRTSDTVSFPPRFAGPGVYLCRAQVIPNPWPDMNMHNDIMLDTFWLIGRILHDVGVSAVTSPTEGAEYDTAEVVPVTFTVENYGAKPETFWTYFDIFSFSENIKLIYSESLQTTDLAVGATADLMFPDAIFHTEGAHIARCSTFLTSDQNWTNNFTLVCFRVGTGGGVAETPERKQTESLGPTVISRAQLLAELQQNPVLFLFDASGRTVLNPKSLSPGVFFLRTATTTRRVLVVR